MTDLRKQLEEEIRLFAAGVDYPFSPAGSTKNTQQFLQAVEALFTTELQKAELRGKMDEVRHSVCKDPSFNFQDGDWEGVTKQKRLNQLEAELNQLEEKHEYHTRNTTDS